MWSFHIGAILALVVLKSESSQGLTAGEQFHHCFHCEQEREFCKKENTCVVCCTEAKEDYGGVSSSSKDVYCWGCGNQDKRLMCKKKNHDGIWCANENCKERISQIFVLNPYQHNGRKWGNMERSTIKWDENVKEMKKNLFGARL